VQNEQREAEKKGEGRGGGGEGRIKSELNKVERPKAPVFGPGTPGQRDTQQKKGCFTKMGVPKGGENRILLPGLERRGKRRSEKERKTKKCKWGPVGG